MSFNFAQFLKRIEAGAYTFVAGEIESNKDVIVAAIDAEVPQAQASLPAINAVIEKHAGPFLAGLVAGELANIEAQGGADLAANLPALIDKLVAGLHAQAAKLLAP